MLSGTNLILFICKYSVLPPNEALFDNVMLKTCVSSSLLFSNVAEGFWVEFANLEFM